ncbi:MAG: Ig-like domain-containing protein, partial [Synergistaceae bacterium]|nr:Ig-like domain-containing protein [Synergistaceae bacterium]
MQKRRWMSWALLVVFAFVAMSGGCGGGGDGGYTPPSGDDTPLPGGEDKFLSVTPTALSLKVGETGTLTAKDFDGVPDWLSGDDSIATVSSSGSATAVVTAVAAGTTDITVIDDSGAEATCRVTVTAGGTPAPGPGPGDDPTPRPEPEPGDDPTPEPDPEVNYSKIVPEIPLKDGEFIEVESVKLKDDVYTLLDADSYVDDNGVLILSRGNAAQESEKDSYIGADELAVGSVLIVPPGERLPSGSQGRITSLSTDGDKIYVTLDSVAAREIFEDLVLNWSIKPDDRSLASESSISGQGIHKTDGVNETITLPIGDVATVNASLIINGSYNAQKETFTQEATLSGSVDLKAYVSLFAKTAEKKLANVKFMMGAIPMGFKTTFSIDLKYKIPMDIALEFGRKFTVRVEKDAPFVESEGLSFEYPGETNLEMVLREGEFTLMPAVTAYLYAGVEDEVKGGNVEMALNASAGIQGKGGYEFELADLEAAETQKYGKGWGIYGKIKVGAKLLAKIGTKIKLFKIVDIGADYSLEHTLLSEDDTIFPRLFLYKIWSDGVPTPPDPVTDNWIDDVDISWYIDDASSYRIPISTAKQLAGLAKLVNSGHKFTGSIFTLTQDIYLSGKTWTPIGNGANDNNRFNGIFDGDGHTIYDMTVKLTNAYGDAYGGLFGYTDQNSDIRNVTLTHLDVSVSSASASASFAGGIVGYNFYGTLTDCDASGSVSVSSSSSSSAGGIVGYNCYGTLTDCAASGGSVSVSSSSS